MIKDAIRSISRLALFAAAGLFVSGTSLLQVLAADLGGDCCADLEERVAELVGILLVAPTTILVTINWNVFHLQLPID